MKKKAIKRTLLWWGSENKELGERWLNNWYLEHFCILRVDISWIHTRYSAINFSEDFVNVSIVGTFQTIQNLALEIFSVQLQTTLLSYQSDNEKASNCSASQRIVFFNRRVVDQTISIIGPPRIAFVKIFPNPINRKEKEKKKADFFTFFARCFLELRDASC